MREASSAGGYIKIRYGWHNELGLELCLLGAHYQSSYGSEKMDNHMSMRQNSILWPQGFLPGFTDNFASNEVIVSGLSASEIWRFLSTPTLWPTYYANSANVRFYDNKGPELNVGDRFYFETFGFPVEAQCTEYVPPADGEPGRVAWHGWAGNPGADDRLDVHHAWLVEDLDGGRVRILTQETQKGTPAKALRDARPNPMINGHQDWLDGMIAEASAAKLHK